MSTLEELTAQYEAQGVAEAKRMARRLAQFALEVRANPGIKDWPGDDPDACEYEAAALEVEADGLELSVRTKRDEAERLYERAAALRDATIAGPRT